MKKYRVYFATKLDVFTRWFRRKVKVSETRYVVVTACNEAHAVKEARKFVDVEALGIPFSVTQVKEASADEAEGCHGLDTSRAHGPEQAS